MEHFGFLLTVGGFLKEIPSVIRMGEEVVKDMHSACPIVGK